MKGKEGGERGIRRRRRKEIEREGGSKRNEMEGKGIRKGKQGEERRRMRRKDKKGEEGEEGEE